MLLYPRRGPRMTTEKTNKTHSARHHKWHKGYNHSRSWVYFELFIFGIIIHYYYCCFCVLPHVRQAPQS